MNMRHGTIAALALLSFTGCGLVHFDVDVEAETVVERGTIIEQFLPMFFDEFARIDLADTREFQNQGVSPEQVDSIRLHGFVLEIIDPEEGVDFTFLRSVAFHVETEGRPKVRIAHAGEDAFETDVRRVELTIDDVELQPYATAEDFSLTTEVSASRRPAQDTTILAQATFRVWPDL